MTEQGNLVVYQTEDGGIALKADAAQETVWATQKQLAEVFGVDVRTVSEHIKSIFKSHELEEKPTVRKFRIVQKEGQREVARNLEHYNLDMMISVGYRVNSKTATKFRKWSTTTLKQHITQGYTINPNRISQNYDSFLHAVNEAKALAKDNQQLQTDDVLALVTAFAQTWFSLESYDEDKLPHQGNNRSSIQLEAHELYEAVAVLKHDLMSKGQASVLLLKKRMNAACKVLWVIFINPLLAMMCIPDLKRRLLICCILLSRITRLMMATNARLPFRLYGFYKKQVLILEVNLHLKL